MPGEAPGERSRLLKAVGRYSAIGIEMGLSVALGYWIGHWLDGKFQTAPWLMIVFVIFGTIAGFRSLYRLARRAMAQQEDSEGDGPPESRS